MADILPAVLNAFETWTLAPSEGYRLRVHRITRFLDFFYRPVFLGVEKRCFGNWICFLPQVKGGVDTY
jgi:hypothetical protein